MMASLLPSQRTLPAVGDRVGGHEILAPLAEGGMAAVFIARPEGRRDVRRALKVLLPHLVKDRAFVDMFLDELRIATQIRHPNVVTVLDGGDDEGRPYLVMELLRGRTLATWSQAAALRGGVLPIGAVLRILASVARGLHAAHQTRGADGALLGVVHRDVSPQNIHVGEDGRVVVLDFGIAAGRGRATATRTGELKGKFRYLAPEQVSRDRPVDPRADLWALGVIAFELLGGEAPFVGEDDASTLWNVMHREVPSIATIGPSLPPEAAAVLDACLRRPVEERPHDAEEVATVLERAARELGVADDLSLVTALGPWSEPTSPLPPTRVQTRRPARIGPALAVLAILAVPISLLAYQRLAPSPPPPRPSPAPVVSPPPVAASPELASSELAAEGAPLEAPAAEAAEAAAPPEAPTRPRSGARRPRPRETPPPASERATSPLLGDPY